MDLADLMSLHKPACFSDLRNKPRSVFCKYRAIASWGCSRRSRSSTEVWRSFRIGSKWYNPYKVFDPSSGLLSVSRASVSDSRSLSETSISKQEHSPQGIQGFAVHHFQKEAEHKCFQHKVRNQTPNSMSCSAISLSKFKCCPVLSVHKVLLDTFMEVSVSPLICRRVEQLV